MYRYTVHAEAQRAHWDAPWRVAGVWVGGQSFWPAYADARAASTRERQAGNVALLELPTVIAADPERAAQAGLVAAREGGGWDREALEAAPSA